MVHQRMKQWKQLFDQYVANVNSVGLAVLLFLTPIPYIQTFVIPGVYTPIFYFGVIVYLIGLVGALTLRWAERTTTSYGGLDARDFFIDTFLLMAAGWGAVLVVHMLHLT
jgi:hypothetical protein